MRTKLTALSISSAISSAILACALCAQAPTSPYIVVFLRPHPSRQPLPKPEAERIQAAHMANILKMAQDGALLAAGPFEDSPTTISGIFVFSPAPLEAVQKLASQDPTVIEHRNTVEAHEWQGPPNIAVEYLRLHKADPKTPENMQVHPLCLLYRGPAWEQAGSRDDLLAAHARYTDELRRQGKLSAAGPVGGADDLRDLIVFKPVSLEDAQLAIGGDPAIKAGVLRVEYHRWWCSDHVLPW